MKKTFVAVTLGALIWCGFALPAPATAGEYSLDELFQLALSRSEKLKVAEENLTISEIGKDKAFSYLLPRLTAFGTGTQYAERKLSSTGVVQPESASSWGVRLDETFSLSGRELTALEISKQGIDRSRYDLSAVREDYLLRFVAVSYYNVLVAKKNLEISDANLDRLAKYRDAAEKRLRIGEVTKTALLRAQGELSGAESDRLQVQNGLELATAVLARNVGLREALTLREELPVGMQVPPLEDFMQQAFSSRTDLKSLEVQRQIAADLIKYAEGAFWPTMTLTGAYAGYEQTPAGSTFNRESVYAGFALNFPFYEGGLRKAEVSEARARERQAALLYEDAKKGVAVEVRSAFLDLLTQKGLLQFLHDQLVFARENYLAVTRQFEFGLSTSLDVLDANALLVSAERREAAADYSYRLALLAMKRVTGTLLATVLPVEGK